jgi:thiol-disulfide isomerase/thioredoxin
MPKKILSAFALLSVAIAADLPRKSPDFTVQLPDGKKAQVSDYRGKVLCVAFILTGCPHCQNATKVLSGLEKELGPKGFQVLEGAINEGADVPAFVRQFQPAFPVGTAGQLDALGYMQLSPMVRNLLPYIAFVDRKGMIRAQFTGADLADENQEKVLRENAEKLVNEPSRPAKSKAKP